MVSAIWYPFCVVPSIIGVMLALDQCETIRGQIRGMPRMVIPGSKTFELAAGDYNVFGESDSVFEGDVYENDDFTFHVPCTLVAPDGHVIALRNGSAAANPASAINIHAREPTFLASATFPRHSTTTDKITAIITERAPVASVESTSRIPILPKIPTSPANSADSSA